MSKNYAEHFLEILRSRDGVDTRVELASGEAVIVRNVAWGRDEGASFDHVTANISPEVDGLEIEFFHTSEIVRIVDPTTSAVIAGSPPDLELPSRI